MLELVRARLATLVALSASLILVSVLILLPFSELSAVSSSSSYPNHQVTASPTAAAAATTTVTNNGRPPMANHNHNYNHNHKQQQHNNSTATAAPYWRRPGCHQVGHTRTISIPGCVKFNLSTNACRGFCMSFAIPAAEDIGPPLAGQLDLDGGLLAALGADSSGQSVSTSSSSSSSSVGSSSSSSSSSPASDEDRRMKKAGGQLGAYSIVGLPAVYPKGGPSGDGSTSTSSSSSNSNHKLQELLYGSKAAALGGGQSAATNGADKRDVVSVGQCCNMMETEDVTVNLRCGLNETRKLVFKSAKTCECFFCKHV